MKRKPRATEIIFGIYCLLLIWIILFKISSSFAEIKLLFGNRSVNIIPFYYQDALASLGFHKREVLLNVIVFIPFGLYLKMLGMGNMRSILYGILFSFTLELCQFVLSLGASDITDIITNTLGTAIGLCACVFIRKIFPNTVKTDRAINILAAIAISIFLFLLIVIFAAN